MSSKHSKSSVLRAGFKCLSNFCVFLSFIISSFNGIFYLQGTQRRKKKVVHRTATIDDKKLQSSLKKLGVSNIPGIEEVSGY